MASQPKYAVPAEFADQPAYAPASDTRSDDEILAAISQHVPVKGEKNVWAYWHSGLANMPAWTRRNVAAWKRICGDSWTIRVLDSVPESPNNALGFAPVEAFVKNTMDGEYFGPHSADLLRGALLYCHGGVFLDVGIVLTRSLDRIFWKQLEDPQSPYRVATAWMYGITMANHIVAARKNDPFIKRWHGLFVYLWRNKTNHRGLTEDPLMAFAQTLSFDDSRASMFHWDFKIDARTVFEYITQVVCWMRLCMLSKDEGDGFIGTEYWQHDILVWDVLQEAWGAEDYLGFEGSARKIFDLLSVPLDADAETEQYKQAYQLTYRLLTKSSMQKFSRSKGLTHAVGLGQLLDDYEGRDSAEGTFGGLLRYGAENFKQLREEIEYRHAPAPPTSLNKGVFEP